MKRFKVGDLIQVKRDLSIVFEIDSKCNYAYYNIKSLDGVYYRTVFSLKDIKHASDVSIKKYISEELKWFLINNYKENL